MERGSEKLDGHGGGGGCPRLRLLVRVALVEAALRPVDHGLGVFSLSSCRRFCFSYSQLVLSEDGVVEDAKEEEKKDGAAKTATTQTAAARRRPAGQGSGSQASSDRPRPTAASNQGPKRAEDHHPTLIGGENAQGDAPRTEPPLSRSGWLRSAGGAHQH